MLLQWFNPFIRLLKRELTKIHEFQADEEVFKTGIDATKYQLLLLKKAIDSGPYTFANSFNHNKLKTRFIMMSKKKSNSWARMKLLLLLPVAALSVYAFARPETTRQIEQVIRSESTTFPPTNQNYSFEFFETELNKFIIEQGGSASLSPEEKEKFIIEKTNFFSLAVNSTNKIAFDEEICTIEQLPSALIKKLATDYPNKKPISIFLQNDRGSSFSVIAEILNIVGKAFVEQKNSDEQKNQPVLLLFLTPKQFSVKSISNSNYITESNPISIAFIDAGKEPRSITFKFQNKDQVKEFVIPINHAEIINKMQEFLESQKDAQFSLVSIMVPSDASMGIIIDLKKSLREYYALKVSTSAK